MSVIRTATAAIIFLGNAAWAQPETLKAVWEHTTPKVFPQAILLDQAGRDCLYVAMKNGGLAILDISKSGVAPKEVAVIPTTQLGDLEVMHLTQRKDLLFLALGDFFNAKGAHAGLAVVNVAKPGEPKVLSVWKSSEKLQGAAAVIVKDPSAYLGAMNHGIFIFDITDPKSIKSLRRYSPMSIFLRRTPAGFSIPMLVALRSRTTISMSLLMPVGCA
jgi:hypothetical protein